MITQDQLKSVLHYDEVTGIFTWKAKTAICITIGSHPKHICKSGYLQMSIFKKRYYAHRLAWLYVYGEFPKKFIDHINGIKTDNRIINLREASISENNQNQKLPSKNNTSGLLGVCYAKKYKKWQSQIEINNKSVFIGYFDTKEEAHIAYINKKRELHPFNTL